MIHINGLTREQCDMLDVIWSFKTKDEYTDWFLCLNEEQQEMARGLMSLLVIAIAEENSTEDFTEANQVLAKFRLKKE